MLLPFKIKTRTCWWHHDWCQVWCPDFSITINQLSLGLRDMCSTAWSWRPSNAFSTVQHSMCWCLLRGTGAWITSFLMYYSLVRTATYVVQSYGDVRCPRRKTCSVLDKTCKRLSFYGCLFVGNILGDTSFSSDFCVEVLVLQWLKGL